MITYSLIDGSYLLHRSIHHKMYGTFRTKKGLPTGGVYGFLSTISKLAKEFGPNLAVAWEGGGSSRKRKLLESYKGQRGFTEQVELIPGEGLEFVTRELSPQETFHIQRDFVMRICQFLNIPSYYAEGMEADDVLATLARQIQISNDVNKAIIYTTDRDLWQTVSQRCSVMYYDSRVKEDVLVDERKVQSEFGSVANVIYLKVLRGDASDNIPPIQVRVKSTQEIKDITPTWAGIILSTGPKNDSDFMNALASHPDFEVTSDTLAQVRRNFELVRLDDKCKLLNTPTKFAGVLDLNAAFELLEFKRFATGSYLDTWNRIRSSQPLIPLV